MTLPAAIMSVVDSSTPRSAAFYKEAAAALHTAQPMTNIVRCLECHSIQAGQMWVHIRPCKLLTMLFGSADELLSGLGKLPLSCSHFAHGMVFPFALNIPWHVP